MPKSKKTRFCVLEGTVPSICMYPSMCFHFMMSHAGLACVFNRFRAQLLSPASLQ